MKIATAADPHIRGKDLLACRSQLGAMLAECVKREVDLVTLAGDIFHSPTIGDNHASTGAIAEVAIGFVAELTKHGIEVVMVPGDHDIAGAGSEDALHVFDGMPGVTICRKPKWLPVMKNPEDGLHIFCLPWNWDSSVSPSEFLAEGMGRDKGTPTMLLAHLRIGGALMSEKKTCEETHSSATRTWQVTRKFLESLLFGHLALGNFHKRQDLIERRGGFIGALRQLDFRFEGDPTGFEIWDTDTGATEWVKLDAAPRHYTIEQAFDEIDYQAVATTREIEQTGARDGDYIRMRIIGGQPDLAEVRKLEAAGVKVEHIISREERIQRADVPEGIVGNPHAMIDLWAGVQHPVIEGEDLARMHRLYDETFADKEPQT